MPLQQPLTLNQLEYSKFVDAIGRDHEAWRWAGALHSVDDHPSVIIDHGREIMWHAYGQRHRANGGPAWIKDFGTTQAFYFLNALDRKDGPAMICNGDKKWYHHNNLHRADGPAIERASGEIEWWWSDKPYGTIDEWYEHSCIDPELFVLLKLEYA